MVVGDQVRTVTVDQRAEGQTVLETVQSNKKSILNFKNSVNGVSLALFPSSILDSVLGSSLPSYPHVFRVLPGLTLL